MSSPTNKSLLGKDHLIIVQIIMNHNRYSSADSSASLAMSRTVFLAAKALCLIRSSQNEIPSLGCDSSFTLLQIASSPYKVILETNFAQFVQYATIMHAQLFQRPFNNSKSISCRWYCQCSLEYFHLYKTNLRLGCLLYDVSGKNIRLTNALPLEYAKHMRKRHLGQM